MSCCCKHSQHPLNQAATHWCPAWRARSGDPWGRAAPAAAASPPAPRRSQVPAVGGRGSRAFLGRGPRRVERSKIPRAGAGWVQRSSPLALSASRLALDSVPALRVVQLGWTGLLYQHRVCQSMHGRQGCAGTARLDWAAGTHLGPAVDHLCEVVGHVQPAINK